MNRLLIIAGLLLSGAIICATQRARLTKLETRHAQLLEQAATLQSQKALLESRRDDLQRKLAEAQTRVDVSRPSAPVSTAPAAIAVPPDSARHGGWPDGADYFYLPKRVLGSLSLVEGICQSNRLTDSAIALYGLTPAEEEAVDAALDTLWTSFRALEIQRMEPIDLPGWIELENAIAYRIPALTNETRALRMQFDATVTAAIGQSRADFLRPQFDDFIQARLNELGETIRVVAFGNWKGGTNLGFAIYDETRRIGDTRVFSAAVLDPEDPIYYYAWLVGIDLPLYGH